jgi:Protein of unknown function (DUF3040)
MSLSPGEREALGEIETHLSGSDPRLAEMLTRGTTRRTRSWPARMSGPRRCPDRGELVRFLVVAIGLALVIGLAVVGVLTTHPATSPGPPGPRHADEVVPTSDYRYGSYR